MLGMGKQYGGNATQVDCCLPPACVFPLPTQVDCYDFCFPAVVLLFPSLLVHDATFQKPLSRSSLLLFCISLNANATMPLSGNPF